MTVSSIAATTAAYSTETATPNTFSSLESNEFMQLLLVELKHQDPLEPMDSNEIMGQLTQLNSLQELQAINGGINNLAENDELVEAASLLDKVVSYVTEDGLVAIGIVEGITRAGEETRLMIGSDSVSLQSILSVQTAAQEG